MTLLDFVILLVVGAICGAIAERIVGYYPGGFFASAAIGFIGALFGDKIAHYLHLPTFLAVNVEGHPIELVWTVLGAIALLLIVRLFRRGGTYIHRHT